MSIKYTPAKRFTDKGELLTDVALARLSAGSAIIEPETVGKTPLNGDDVIAAVEEIDAALESTYFTKSGTETIASGDHVRISDFAAAPDGANWRSIVSVNNSYTHIYLTGYVDGSVVRFIAHNISNTGENISNGDLIRYAVHASPNVGPQPSSPNAALVVTARQAWLDDDGLPIGAGVAVGNMNRTANPYVTLVDGTITEVELNSATIADLAAKHTGARKTKTFTGSQNVPYGAATLLGTVVLNPGTSHSIVRCGQTAAGPLLTGYVSSSNGTTTVSLYGRSMEGAAITEVVPAGTQVKIIVY